MNRNQQRVWILIVAAALSLPVLAQDNRANDYRYPSADDAARQNVQPAPQQVQQQPQQQSQQPPAAQPLCTTCGMVDSIRTTEKPGEGSAVGLIAGGVLGGLLGHQVGQGRGNTAATIVGAAGGAYAGHQIEKNVKKVLRYDVSVRMDDGNMRSVSYDVEPGFRTGDKVRFIDGRLTRY
ncbi:MAG: glycine zipper 2TM domain-containing protein [Betaproteobacteria bacterium]|nr:glycine zipper 2TM domain-containing protein [Betaproteobacteria bacterium]